jgi:ABC-type sugar transport system ATPase subunit
LSGGQAQRVAIGRALVQEPAIFLFDEPLSNLDAELRLKMRVEIGALHQALGKTMIYVTHDQVEAMTLADTIVVLRDGAIEQVGRPLDLYRAPCNQFVAGFIGSPAMNMLPDPTGRAVTMGVRPEHIEIRDDGTMRGVVKVVERLGSCAFVYVDCATQSVCIEATSDVAVHAGETIRFTPRAERIYLFDAAGRTVSRA